MIDGGLVTVTRMTWLSMVPLPQSGLTRRNQWRDSGHSDPLLISSYCIKNRSSLGTEWVSTDNLEEDGGQQQSSGELDEELWDRVEGVRHKLTRILNPAKLTPFLRQCKAIDEQDEDEVLNSTQYPLRISKAGRLLDILRGRGQRGLQAFMECLEFYHPGEYTQLTGRRPTQRCSMLVDEEGPEGLTQFLLLEVRKLREQLRSSRQCERRLSQRCRLEELKNRLMEAEKQAEGKTIYAAPVKTESRASFCPVITPTVPELPCIKTPREAGADTQALLDILQQDRREAAEQRQELCSTITRLQGELESTEAHRDKLVSQCEQLRVKVRTLQLDWETEQKRSVSYFNQIMELERERDQALRSRDSLQLEYTDCLLDKDRLRKQVIELQASLDALKRDRELERERQKEEELAREKGCPHCSHLCPFSNDHCYELCCSLRASEPDMTMCGSPLSDGSHRFQRKVTHRSLVIAYHPY
ncbi:hypothetical protein Z043_111972 [Scleropages formosus]|uniref:CARD domain-containing protein n=1 Tax=Scleropages formosus TaxID=113540 RepID=A0A0P7X5C9_SCLFO|nr:hypothetical protein Z043_111972 [Scleropages formosus]